MPLSKSAAVSQPGEVWRKFQEPGIADRVLAACKWADKQPEQLAIALGIRRGSDKGSRQAKFQQIEHEMDRLIQELDLPLEKHFHGSVRADGERVGGSYVTYGLKRERPPLFQGRKEPQIKTYTIAELQQKERSVVMAKTAKKRSTEELEVKLDEILADLSQVNPLNMHTIKCLGSFSNCFLSGQTDAVKLRREKVFDAIKAERVRRENQRTDTTASIARAPHTKAEQEAVIDAIHPELAQPQPDLVAELEQLRQQNKALQRRCEALQQANEELAEQPAHPDPSEVVKALRAQLEQRREAITQELAELEAELRACDRLQDRLGKKPLRLAS